MILSREIQNRIASFQKFAQFVSQKFNVRVILDGKKAETNGTDIYLPNLAGLSEEEVEFLYCILLHEVGHVKFSDFSKESFKRIKSQSHFFIANSLEDARSENCLMKEYDGAEEIFNLLYNKFFMDRTFMTRILGERANKIDLFFGVTLYLHHHLVKLKNKVDFSTLFDDAETVKEVFKFIEDNKIIPLLDSSKLRNWEDVLELSLKIYDMFFKAGKDSSKKTSIEDMDKAVESSKQKLNKEELLKPIKEAQAKVKEQEKILADTKAKHQPVIDKLDKEISNLDKQLSDLDKRVNVPSIIESLKKRSEDYQAKLDKKSEHLKKVNDKLSKATDPEKIAKLQKTKQNHEKWIKRLESMIKETAKEIEDLLKNYPPMSQEEHDEQVAPIMEDLGKKGDERSQNQQEIDSQSTNLEQAKQELQQVTEQQSKEMVKVLRAAQDQMDGAGIETSLLPECEGNPDWEDAVETQQQFDQDAMEQTGKIVQGGKVSNIRDVITTLDEAIENMEHIDLAKIFQTQNNVDPFDSFNIKSTSSSDKKESFESSRQHVPLTTEYDSFSYQNSSDKSELLKIISENQADIETVKNIFRNKFKVVKKKRFKGHQEEGSLDQRSLWQLATKTSDEIFELPNPKIYNETIATVAMDVSGSMDKHEDEIKKIALMISEGLGSCLIRHEVLGYHAPVSMEMRDTKCADMYNRKVNKLETIVYRNFNDKTNQGIQNIKTHCSDNSDGESLHVLGKRLLNERAKRRLLFIVTDGKPYLSGSDITMLDQDLRDTLNWLTRNGVEIYAIGFDVQGSAFYKSYCTCGNNSDLINFLKNLK